MSEESKTDNNKPTPPLPPSESKPPTIQDISMEAPMKHTLDKLEGLKFQAELRESLKDDLKK